MRKIFLVAVAILMVAVAILVFLNRPKEKEFVQFTEDDPLVRYILSLPMTRERAEHYE